MLYLGVGHSTYKENHQEYRHEEIYKQLNKEKNTSTFTTFYDDFGCLDMIKRFAIVLYHRCHLLSKMK